MVDPCLYVIIQNPRISYRDIARTCIRYRIPYLQLREKDLTDRDFLKAGKILLEETCGTDTTLVINDRVHIAKKLNAPAVHLGQKDMPLTEAREVMPPETIFGLSTHNFDQLKRACKQKPDYAGFGPIYPTTTKKQADPVTGTQLLKEAVSLANIPLVAIGGIFPEQLQDVIAAGPRFICMVRHLMQAKDTDVFCSIIENLKSRLELTI